MTLPINREREPYAAREFDRQSRKLDFELGYCSTCGQPLPESESEVAN